MIFMKIKTPSQRRAGTAQLAFEKFLLGQKNRVDDVDHAV
jgi:hypothetical protein